MSKIKSYNNFINEKVVEGIDIDVDYIYQFFKKDIDEIHRTGKVTKNMFKHHIISSKDLKSDISKKCHKKNPCEIHINHDLKINNVDLSNFYTPKGSGYDFSKHTSIIGIKIPNNVMNLVLDEGYGDLKFTNEMFDGIKREFTEYKIKGSIQHELSHWINDTIDNRYLSKILKKRYIKNLLNKNKVNNVNALDFEIYAIIQNIYQLKKEFSNIWDEMTFEEMLEKSPALSNMDNYLDKESYKKWKRKVKTKMWKSNLLGKNMV